MHISEIQLPSNTILTKCSKMTEESHRRHGMNGTGVDSVVVKEEFPKSNYVQGGRLKFFKDGKFILELERAREGERVSWVSVPRKTFWPPQGTAASTPTYRQESSTSLSVSDDNSSIQSSPWQRDHSWKQTTPRRNLSKELTLYFWRPKHKRVRKRSKKRRRPYSASPEASTSDEQKVQCSERITKNNVCNNTVNNCKTPPKFKGNKRSLLAIVQNLIDKNFRTSTPPRTEMVVSPRKRFLREMEKDNKLQLEDNCQKRSRSKPQSTSASSAQPSTAATPPAAVSKVGSPISSVVTPVNGVAPASSAVVDEVKPPVARNCSYSITSLLAEDRNIKRSPSNSPSHFPTAATVTQHQQPPHYCSPSPTSTPATATGPDDRWYSESVDRLRSIELSQVEKRSGFSPYPLHQSYMPPPYMYQFPPVPSYYTAGLYGRAGYVVPSMYHTSPMHIPVTRHEAPSCSWVAEPPRDSEHRDETITDMPLNLSKHAG